MTYDIYFIINCRLDKLVPVLTSNGQRVLNVVLHMILEPWVRIRIVDHTLRSFSSTAHGWRVKGRDGPWGNPGTRLLENQLHEPHLKQHLRSRRHPGQLLRSDQS